MKPLFDTSNSSSLDSADAFGHVTFEEFLNPDTEFGIIGFSVIMDVVVCQSDPVFVNVIQKLRDGQCSFQRAEVFMNCRLSNLPQEEQQQFKERALYIMPTWNSTLTITVEHL